MANPIVQDRVSPSGPLADEAGPDGGLTPPSLQVAGDYYIADQTVESSFVGKMLPFSTTSPIITIYNSDSPAPSGDVIAMDPLMTPQPLTAGLWLVKLELEGGFLTSFPQSDLNWGALTVEMEFADDDGAGAKTAIQENLALPMAFYTNELEPVGVLGKTTVTFLLSVSEEEALAANGFPRRRFALSRHSATGAYEWPQGEIRFTSTSGIYEIHKESMFSVQRIR